MEPIIKSLLDTDLYKLTQQCAVAKIYPDARVRYKFINRGGTEFDAGFAELLREQVQSMSELRLTKDEKAFLAERCPFLNPFYRDFLAGYQYDPSEVHISQSDEHLSINIEGHWYRTILWEVTLMSLISEVYFKTTKNPHMKESHIISPGDSEQRATIKGSNFREFGIYHADFGSRRRYSLKNHERVVKALKKSGREFFVGTSNVLLAMQNDVKPIGTQAHEWFMYHAAEYGYRMANSMSLEKWVDAYEGSLGIALTDTFTTPDFFRVFGTLYAKLYDGVRHDSGDPIAFGEAVISHYEKLGIDPKTKTIVFSDGLDVREAMRIHNDFKGRIKISFGIGTNFTNDVGAKPINMVIKMVEAFINGKWVSTVKLSDNEGKHTGNEDAIKLAKQVLEV